jgi:hypothetical protein
VTNYDHRSFFKKPEMQCIKCLEHKNVFEFKRSGYLSKKISLTCKVCQEKSYEKHQS